MANKIIIDGTLTNSSTLPTVQLTLTPAITQGAIVVTLDAATKKYQAVLDGVAAGTYEVTAKVTVPGTSPLITAQKTKTVEVKAATPPPASGDTTTYFYNDFEAGATTLEEYEFMTI